jgi:LPS-assembly protein
VPEARSCRGLELSRNEGKPAPLRSLLARSLVAALLCSPPAHGQATDCPTSASPDQAQAQNTNPAALDTELADQPIQIESAGAEVSRSGDASLLGEVTVRQGNRTLYAETASYDAATRAIKVEGDVEYSDPELRVRGATGTWNADRGGRFSETEFELPSRPARGSADQLSLSPEGNLTLKGVLFTTCPAGNDDWLFKASSIEIDRDKQQGTGRNVRLDFKGVPLLYAPYISFPAGPARKSGFLFPAVGTSSSSGFEFGIPYYFNLAPNYDATLEPTWLSQRGLELGGNFRYLTDQSRGRIDGRFLPSDQKADRDRGYVRLRHLTDFTNSLRLSASLEDASDSQYFEDFARGPEGTSITYLERRIALQYLGSGWRASALLQNYQTIDQTIGESDRPYSRVPQLVFDGAWPVAAAGLAAGISGELVHFERDYGVVGTRFDAEPTISWPIHAAGYFFEPSAGYRYTAYQLDGVAPGESRSPWRGAPIVSVDTGLLFDRPAGSRGKLVQTLEPRVLYTWIPYRNQDDLPVFDTGLPALDMVQLFRTNRYVGADRLADTNQVAVGVTTRLLEANSGRQYLAATIGQQYFFEQSSVTLPGEPPDQRNASDLIAELELSAYRNWNVDLGLQWDPQDSNTALGQASVQYRPRSDTVVNLGYRYRAGQVEQWEGSTAWRIDRQWTVYARYVYSVRDAQSLDAFAGLEYESCCWRLRVVANRYVSNRTGSQDTSLSLQLELKGLSSVGTTSSAFLERGIRGYSRDPESLP